MSEVPRRVSIFPSLLSPVLMIAILYQFIRRRVQQGVETVRELTNNASHVVGLAALLSIPVVWTYSALYFDHPTSQLPLSGALMSFVWVSSVGYLSSFPLSWLILKFDLARPNRHAG
jgi:hypothetical protein